MTLSRGCNTTPGKILDFFMGRTLVNLFEKCTPGNNNPLNEQDLSVMHQEIDKCLVAAGFRRGQTAEQKQDLDATIRDKFQSTLVHFAQVEYPQFSAHVEDGHHLGDRGYNADHQWLASPRTVLAAIILCDQFPRHIFRGKAESFAYDGIALALAKYLVRHELDMQLHPFERLWIYLPYMHSENLDHQRKCIALYEKTLAEDPLVKEHDIERVIRNNIAGGKKHLVMIEKFGRFPHRNIILGRESTKEELEYLGITTDKYI